MIGSRCCRLYRVHLDLRVFVCTCICFTFNNTVDILTRVTVPSDVLFVQCDWVYAIGSLVVIEDTMRGICAMIADNWFGTWLVVFLFGLSFCAISLDHSLNLLHRHKGAVLHPTLDDLPYDFPLSLLTALATFRCFPPWRATLRCVMVMHALSYRLMASMTHLSEWSLDGATCRIKHDPTLAPIIDSSCILSHRFVPSTVFNHRSSLNSHILRHFKGYFCRWWHTLTSLG